MTKVLIVNEDAQLAHLIGLVLRRQGYQVNLAPNAASGREQVALIRPDLLIASKRQVENEQQAFYAMRAMHRCPLILICDSPGSTTEALFRPDLLPLPFRPQELVRRVKQAQKTLQ